MWCFGNEEFWPVGYNGCSHKKKDRVRRSEHTLVQCTVTLSTPWYSPLGRSLPMWLYVHSAKWQHGKSPPHVSLLTFPYFSCIVAFEITLHKLLFTALPEEKHWQHRLEAGKHSCVNVNTARGLLPQILRWKSLIYCSVLKKSLSVSEEA